MRIEKLSADANYLNIGQDFFGLALVKLCKTSMEETWSDYWGSLRTGPNMLHAIFHLKKKTHFGKSRVLGYLPRKSGLEF